MDLESKLNLRYWDDPILSTECEPVRETEFGPKLEAFAGKMIETMQRYNGVGLAAPQVGVNLRLFVMAVPESDDILAVCNPIITPSGFMKYAQEGCLSVPNVFEQVGRPEEVRMRYWTPQGEEEEAHLQNLPARIVQHEVDHLDGIMFFDRRRVSRQVNKSVERAWEKERARLKV
jgi:peptide deformylase